MIHDGRFKLIYYPWGNRIQLFDLEQDPMEMKDLSGRSEVRQIQEALEKELMQQLYGEDVNWISDGKLTGVEAPKYREKADYGFSNQRGLHWPVVMPVSKDSAGS